MFQKVSLVILLGSLSMISANAWNARFAPEEATVMWPTPESAQDRAGTIFRHSSLPGPVLNADVEVDGIRTPMTALFDDSGNLIWSVRTPEPTEGFTNEMHLQGADQLFAIYTDETSTTEVIGNFDAGNGFVPRYQLSLPALPPSDPIQNPLGVTRFYQPQGTGDLAILDISGSDIKVIMLDNAGNVRFAKVYSMPSGGGFSIPGFPSLGGLTYSFAIMSSLQNGDYYLMTSGADLTSQSAKAWALRINSAGGIIWSKGYEVPGFTALTTPLQDERVVIAGGTSGATVDSVLALLSPEGDLVYSKKLTGAVLLATGPDHYEESGNLLLSGSVITSFSQSGITMDGAAIILSPTGEKVSETAFDLGPLDFFFHVGSDGNSLYFDISSTDTNGTATHAILAKTDSMFSNWLTRSYEEKVGFNALGSSFILDTGIPSLTYRDESQDYLYYQQLTEDLLPDGDCDLFVDTAVEFYDPEIIVAPLTLQEETDTITVEDYSDAPVLSPFPFDLINTPLVVEGVCGDNNSGGSDPVSLWMDIAPANAEGDKLAGIGWINDKEYPYIWHYTIGGYMYILDDYSTLDNIYGWDYMNGFWFWANDGWGGWYVNLLDPEWGIGGWAKWE